MTSFSRVLLLLIVGGLLACSPKEAPLPPAACASCHVLPPPAAATQEGWERILPVMTQRMENQLSGAEKEALWQAYMHAAPEHFALTRAESTPDPRFRAYDIPPFRTPDGNTVRSKSACVTYLSEEDTVSGHSEVVYCDSDNGRLMSVRLDQPSPPRILVDDLRAPVRVERSDLNGDGKTDLLVTDIGSIEPGSTGSGAVIAYLQGDNMYNAIPLFQGRGRLADAVAGDLDGDGDTDVVIAEFGNGWEGGIWLLEQEAPWGEHPPVAQRLDRRAGPVDLALTDLNGDGFLDIVAAIAQQHEVVVAWLGSSDGQRTLHTLTPTRHPAWGTISIEIADMDGDGAPDLIVANGDSLDTSELRPYHSVRVYRNRNGLPSEELLVGQFPAVCGLEAMDLDGDGDIDIAATSWAPPGAIGADDRLASVVWFENNRDTFVRHDIEIGHTDRVSITAVPKSQNQKPGLAVARLRLQRPEGIVIGRKPSAITLFTWTD